MQKVYPDASGILYSSSVLSLLLGQLVPVPRTVLKAPVFNELPDRQVARSAQCLHYPVGPAPKRVSPFDDTPVGEFWDRGNQGAAAGTAALLTPSSARPKTDLRFQKEIIRWLKRIVCSSMTGLSWRTPRKDTDDAKAYCCRTFPPHYKTE